jgi:4-amino-4-deoxy-L-arabinose transferase-like glycosyltransferase
MSALGTQLRRFPRPSAFGARLRRVPLPLALLLAVAAVLSASWSLATAPLQGPDETDHVGYIEHLAETGSIPSATTGTGGAFGGDEDLALQAGGYLRLLQNRQVRPPWSTEAERRFRAAEDALPADARKTGAGPNSVAKNPPLYYALGALGRKLTPGGHFFGQLFVLRAISGVLLLAMVLFTWLLAGEVFRRRLPQTIATAVVALLPMAGFMSGIVSTDILLAAVTTLFLWLALRTVRLALSWQRGCGLAAVVVAAVLTHGRGLALVPALLVVLVVTWFMHHRSVRSGLISAAAAAGVLVVGGVAYRIVASAAGGGGALYGGEANLGNTSAFSVRQLASSIWQFYLPKLDSMEARLGPPIGYRQIFVQQYFAGVFSSFEVYFPYWVYDLVQVVVLLGAIALYTLGIVCWRATLAAWPKIVVLAATAGSVLIFLHVASYRALVNGGDNPLIVGRYLLPLTAILGVSVAAIVAALPRRAGAVLGALVVVGLLALSLAGLALNVERFYA